MDVSSPYMAALRTNWKKENTGPGSQASHCDLSVLSYKMRGALDAKISSGSKDLQTQPTSLCLLYMPKPRRKGKKRQRALE